MPDFDATVQRFLDKVDQVKDDIMARLDLYLPRAEHAVHVANVDRRFDELRGYVDKQLDELHAAAERLTEQQATGQKWADAEHAAMREKWSTSDQALQSQITNMQMQIMQQLMAQQSQTAAVALSAKGDVATAERDAATAAGKAKQTAFQQQVTLLYWLAGALVSSVLVLLGHLWK